MDDATEGYSCHPEDLVPVWVWGQLFPLLSRPHRRDIAGIVASALTAHLYDLTAGDRRDSQPLLTADRLGLGERSRWSAMNDFALIVPRYPFIGLPLLVLIEVQIDRRLLNLGDVVLGKTFRISSSKHREALRASCAVADTVLETWVRCLPAATLRLERRRRARRGLELIARACQVIEARRPPYPYVVTRLAPGGRTGDAHAKSFADWII